MRVRLQQKQVGQRRIRRKLNNRLSRLFAHGFDHTLRVLACCVRQIAIFRVGQHPQRVIKRTFCHAADGIFAKERLFQCADARAGIGVAWLWHVTLPPLSRRAADRPRSLPRPERLKAANGRSNPSHIRRPAG
ncbi:hypothetical protein SDC9_141981 [bioreactor metagenome]|uniref:Uncharacterized protein n=1 Tax=bioreactor metagenome TaxID=1076179 RepID=A0A645E1X8_9ZZZZ